MTSELQRRVSVLGQSMAYIETGNGDPIVFLHGNPTSSFLWRNVIPHVQASGRCIAPDLIGMGDSDPLPASSSTTYRFVDHRQYLDAFLEAVGATRNVLLVLHDWGSALGFDWARRHVDAVRGIAYMEAFVRPLRWDEWPAPIRPVFEMLRSEAGEAMILEQNLFIEQMLPAGVLRPLTDAELAEYRRPFATPGERRRPMLTWPREVPLDGEPADVHAIVEAYASWLSTSRVSKLFINAEPGAILTGAPREFAAAGRTSAR